MIKQSILPKGTGGAKSDFPQNLNYALFSSAVV